MSKPNPDSSSASSSTKTSKPISHIWRFSLLFSVLVPVLAATLVYRLDSFDPAPLPLHELAQVPVKAQMINDHMLQGAELVGIGNLKGPEDLAYDHKSGVVYTGCADGWIKRVKLSHDHQSVSDAKVENWVNTGGRPLGLVLGHNNEVIVAEPHKGLLNVSRNGEVELLTDEAEGKKFKLTDGVDVAEDGMIYFTDGSSKYSFEEHVWDILEGRPYGRLMSFDPSTKETKVLVHDLYFANGVVVSPDQKYVIFCETPMRRCRKYQIKGEKKGTVESFIDNLPGLPDNIRYDGLGHYWIGLASGITPAWNLALKYPFVRKIAAIMEKTIGRPHMEKNGGVFAVDLEGNPIAHYYDSHLSLVSGGIKIGDNLYCGSVYAPYIIKLNLTRASV